ncbi:MAG: hypothetical protein ACT6Q7_18630 [Blastomonas fulva]|uniref:hypothetical protein n=1 Tax=Blastomonas fulva TaxID=1550728 RepID=UPI00403451BC
MPESHMGEVIATLECRSVQPGVPAAVVEIDGISDAEVTHFRQELTAQIATGGQVSDAVARVFVALVQHCPNANPSDLWQHVIYRHTLSMGWNDAQWKRVSGFALERALVAKYQPKLTPRGLKMHIVKSAEANRALAKIGIHDVKATKVDLFVEGLAKKDVGILGQVDEWVVFGSAHVKSSIAERIQDDVPASRAFMDRGFTSIVLTMDAKSYPPPHGNCVNYGELGGRSLGVEKDRLKRRYVEVDGQFDGLFSFNLRTPPSPADTPSGKRIYTLGMHEEPDKLVEFLAGQWKAFAAANDLTIS